MPALASPRSAPTLEAVRSMAGGFDLDAFHVMDRRDDELVAEELLHGALSASFVYNFEISGKQITGISVVGARHLAAHYRGLRHRLVASTQKTGELFTFTSFPAENMPMSVSCAVVPELAQEPDFYSVVVDLADIKAGNTLQIERREDRYEYRRDGTPYERPNYQAIAQSKAFRNAVLSIVPQDVLLLWREQMLRLKKGETIAVGVLQQKRANVLQFAARHAIALDRRRIESLTLDQIAGLGDAARDGALPAFVRAAQALGLEVGHAEAGAAAAEALPEPAKADERPPTRRGRPPRAARPEGGDSSTGGEQRAQEQEPRPQPASERETAPEAQPTSGIPAAEVVPAPAGRLNFD
jgi:hypothetical protein